MSNKLITTLGSSLFAAWALCSSLPAHAHHSFAMFDHDKFSTLEGTIYAVELKSPHSWFWIAVPNQSGGTDVWGLEMASAGGMVRIGLTKKDLVIGSKVSIDIHPLKNGEHGGQFLRVSLPDGRQFGSLDTQADALKKDGVAK